MPRKILLLHGNRQTGQLLLGRMDKLRKKLQAINLELVAPDALFENNEDPSMRQWWNRVNNEYLDLDVTLQQIESIWTTTSTSSSSAFDDDPSSSSEFIGIMGFSMGARLAHLLAVAHSRDPERFLCGLQFVIMVAGYDAPLPDGFDHLFAATAHDTNNNKANKYDLMKLRASAQSAPLLRTPSLHVWGETDRLIFPTQSQAVMKDYQQAERYTHAGGHHIPMQAESIRAYLHFIEKYASASCSRNGFDEKLSSATRPPDLAFTASRPTAATIQQQQAPVVNGLEPDEETKQIQTDEVEALTAIFPEEVSVHSNVLPDGTYQSPIQFAVDLTQSDIGSWPPRPIQLQFTFPFDYPETSIPRMQLVHDMNVMQFSSSAASACVTAMTEAAKAEQGMPSVMSCIYAARDYFESDALLKHLDQPEPLMGDGEDANGVVQESDDAFVDTTTVSSTVQAASPERIEQCILRGLSIAESLLRLNNPTEAREAELASGKGGSWVYTLGLVGKPSAGKSTFFNTATAFARQRFDRSNALGGAAMAPHPFTTIDPNTGCALVPAPWGSCPEDDDESNSTREFTIGNSHGRDSRGRRLIPVLLKDVAGLVPGAYQGRGRGNKFLNDLCDADVLIHVMDASGTADTDGNDVGFEEDGVTPCSGASNPLNDLAWIRKELIEWVYTNLLVKWDTIKRKGRSKLEAMFNGYGQKAAVTWSILYAVEKEMETTERREKPLDHLDNWDEADIHLLVSAFLGVRFPMALALNKCDLPSSEPYIQEVMDALPAHGAHVGTPICARREMSFIKETIEAVIENSRYSMKYEKCGEPPIGVWQCLQSAVTLKEPILVFPVADFTTFAPLPGLSEYVLSDASLPSPGMVACLQKAGGSAPSAWDDAANTYAPDQLKKNAVALRDVLIMKPGSTIEDVFLALKRLSALGGEFIRAEATGCMAVAPKPVQKHEIVSKETRIVKIMTSKRTSWQANHR